MNCEKKYNEALELARANHKFYKEHTDCDEHFLNDVKLLEAIFPELRESEDEDERIRKAIIGHLKNDVDFVCNGITKDECLAWLEEQKDKNCLACDQHLKGYIAGRKVTEEEKQKEQKPVMGNGISEQTKMNETVYKFTSEEWKKALDEQLPKEQKPAEWSEEDEKCLELVIDCVYEFYPDPVMKYKLKDWLKHLRPSWKPSEINPEEVRLLDTTISFLKDFADKGYENAVECIDWLKSKRNGTARK